MQAPPLPRPVLTNPSTTSMALIDSDVNALFSWCQCVQRKVQHVPSHKEDGRFLPGEFSMVPPRVLALMSSLVSIVSSLRRMLTQDWVSGWNGWSMTRTLLGNSREAQELETIAID